MSENNLESHQKRYPRKLLVFTGIVAVLLFLMHWQAFYINEQFGLDPAIASLIPLVACIILVTAWGFWTYFWAKRRIIGVLIFLVPIGFFTLYYPNVTGDMNFAGFKPRFWSDAGNYVETISPPPAAGLDLLTTSAKDFPQFLGPQRNARLETVELESSWETPPELVWKMDVGEGWSGFVVVNGFAITQEQRGAEECVTCYELSSGELKWIYRANRRHEDLAAMGKVGPRATPSIHEGLVYVTSATGILDCLDGSTGELVWSADIPALVGIKQNISKNSLGLEYSIEDSRLAWGRSGSPLIVDDLVVVPAGGPNIASGDEDSMATLIAFDRKTGVERWRGGNRMPSYGSPGLATIGGRKQVLFMAEDSAVGHDAESGEELWSFFRRGMSNANANCSQVTVVGLDDDRLVLSKGYGLGGELIQVSSDDGDWQATSLKKDPRILKTKLTNPVILDGHLYSLSDGYLECANIESFSRVWKQRGRFGNGQILLAGDKLLVHSESGRLFLVQATPDGYMELGSVATIDGICWNTLCLYGDLLLVRSDREAACFRLPVVTE